MYKEASGITIDSRALEAKIHESHNLLVNTSIRLARLQNGGVNGAQIDNALQVIHDLMYPLLPQPITDKQYAILGEACGYVIDNIEDFKRMPAYRDFNKPQFIQIIHWLVEYHSKKKDEPQRSRIAKVHFRFDADKFLVFLYQDFLKHGATVQDFFSAYDALSASRPFFDSITDWDAIRGHWGRFSGKKCGTILHLVVRYWRALGVERQDIIKVIQLMQGESTLHRDGEGNTVIHLIAMHWLQSHSSETIAERIEFALSTIKDLFCNGSILNLPSANGDNLLHIVCATWPELGVPIDLVLKSVLTLKCYDVDIRMPNKQGNLPIHCVFLTWHRVAVTVKQLEEALYYLLPLELLGNSAKVLPINQGNAEGTTLLHSVCDVWTRAESPNLQLITDTIRLLFAHEATADAVTADGYTALHYICTLGKLTNDQAIVIIKLLIKESAWIINCKTVEKGETPLHFFCRYWFSNVSRDPQHFSQLLEHLDYFLECRADVDAPDMNGSTPVHELLHCWIQQGASPKEIFSAISRFKNQAANFDARSTVYGKPANIVGREWIQYWDVTEVLTSLKSLKKLGVRVGVRDSDGRNLLSYFSQEWVDKLGDQPLSILEELLKIAPRLRVKMNSRGTSPVHVVCREWLSKKIAFATMGQVLVRLISQNKKPDAIKKLLNTPDSSGDTPTLIMIKNWSEWGVKFSKLKIILEYCLKSGADVQATDKHGKTLLYYIMEKWLTAFDQQDFDYFAELTQRLDLSANKHHRSHVGKAIGLLVGDKAIPRELSQDIVEGLLAIGQRLLDNPVSRISLLRTISTFVDDQDNDNDGDLVVELLQGLKLERLFSENACQPKRVAPPSGIFSFFSGESDDASDSAYSTDTALVYVHIVDDGVYVKLKRHFEADPLGATDILWIRAVNELLQSITAKDSPIPEKWMDEVFNERIAELQALNTAIRLTEHSEVFNL